MTTATARAAILADMTHGARMSTLAAVVEGERLRGERGADDQAQALSARYMQIRAAGHPSKAAIRAAMLEGRTSDALALVCAAMAEIGWE